MHCNSLFIMQTLSLRPYSSFTSAAPDRNSKPVSVLELFSVSNKTPTHEQIVGHASKFSNAGQKKKKEQGGAITS